MDFLAKLINAFGVSGSEARVRELIRNEIKDYADDITVDSIGNLVVHKKGKGPSVMLAAHMDEVGLMVKRIGTTGRIEFSMVGGIEPIVLVGQRVRIHTKTKHISGVISNDEITQGAEMEELPTRQTLFVDTGLNNAGVKKAGIQVGQYIELEGEPLQFLGSKDIVSGKALDDRIGCYILVELIKKLKDLKRDVYYVFTVQEEVGLYGAKLSSYKIEPNWAVVVDVTDQAPGEVELGKGPTLTIKDSEMISNPCLNDWMQEIAKKKKIPLQLEVSEFGTTDALSISLTKGGVPSTALGVAVRNLHSTIGIANRKDIENAIKLLEGLLCKPPKTCVIT